MTREEAIAHLGTIAKSGTAEFFGKLSGDQQKDSQLIGQFGVGFYSAFIVAERVEVLTRKAGAADEDGVRWESKADGEFTVESVTRPQRGTAVVLHLKEDAREFADPYRLRSLIRRYSDHIGFPVLMRKEGAASLDYEPSTRPRRSGRRPRGEITDDEYKQFYQHISHDHTDPIAWSHNKVEGKREYTSLLFVPGRAPFDLWQRDAARGSEAVRAARFHHGRRRAVPAALPAVREGRDRLERPAAQRLARAAAGGRGSRSHPRRAHQARARPADPPCRPTSRTSTARSGRNSAPC